MSLSRVSRISGIRATAVQKKIWNSLMELSAWGPGDTWEPQGVKGGYKPVFAATARGPERAITCQHVQHSWWYFEKWIWCFVFGTGISNSPWQETKDYKHQVVSSCATVSHHLSVGWERKFSRSPSQPQFWHTSVLIISFTKKISWDQYWPYK